MAAPTAQLGLQLLPSNPSKPHPKTPAHTLIRVRNNQRRHRARRREYIASLELKLQESEQQLVQARAEIATLKSELALWKNRPVANKEQRKISELMVYDAALPLTAPSSESQTATGSVEVKESVAPVVALPSPEAASGILIPAPIPPPMTRSLQRSCCSESRVSSSSNSTLRNEPTLISATQERFIFPQTSQTCRTTPASEDESTSLCSEAYILIAQQNFRGLDELTIRDWLYESFRQGRTQKEGCRVENKALFELLDYISNV